MFPPVAFSRLSDWTDVTGNFAVPPLLIFRGAFSLQGSGCVAQSSDTPPFTSGCSIQYRVYARSFEAGDVDILGYNTDAAVSGGHGTSLPFVRRGIDPASKF